MQRILDVAAELVRRRPGTVLAGLLATTLLLGGAASRIQVGVDIADHGTGTELAEAFEHVSDEFGARSASVTVIVGAGEGGTVLDPQTSALVLWARAGGGRSHDPPEETPTAGAVDLFIHEQHEELSR